jgi:hypothetical protein
MSPMNDDNCTCGCSTKPPTDSEECTCGCNAGEKESKEDAVA